MAPTTEAEHGAPGASPTELGSGNGAANGTGEPDIAEPDIAEPATEAEADTDEPVLSTDDTDVLAVARSEVVGFEDFYRAHADTVRRALAVTLGDAHVAAEATDEAMTRALARWRKVSAHESPAGWVYRVGLNWAVSRWRRLRREAPMPGDDEAGSGHGSRAVVEPPDPLAAAAASALQTLPLDQRAVVVCRVLLECSTAETAALLDLPLGTVKSRLARGLAVLRSSLATPDPDEASR